MKNLTRHLSVVLGLLLLCGTALGASWNGKVYRTSDFQEISYGDFVSQAALSDLIVLGEKHYTAEVQAAEGQAIDAVASYANLADGALTVAWEFLNASSQAQTDELFEHFVNGHISAEKFLRITQGNEGATVYAPVLEAAKKHKGRFFGVNLSREEKTPVTQHGISAVDPKLIPPGYQPGGARYFERFKEAMAEHVPADKLQNYFDAQSLTDDVMAYNLLQDRGAAVTFLVAGSFHTDFYDGTVKRLRVRAPNLKIATVHIIDASDFKESELLNQLRHPVYGPVADFVIFVKEPVK